MKLSLAFTVYPSGIAKNQEHVSVYLRNCNEGTVYIHASLDFLGEKHDIRQCITSGLVGFVSPGIVINDDRGSSRDSSGGLYCKFHKITKYKDVWDKYNETISTNKLQPLTPVASKYRVVAQYFYLEC